MAISKEQRWKDIHTEALAEFDEIQKACRETRDLCLQARRFAVQPGAQWEGALSEQFAERPQFEFNRVHLAGLRVINEYRNNRIDVDFVAKDGQDSTMADTCDGLHRADMQACNAQEALDTAFGEDVFGGIGAWRYRAVYEDEYDEDNDQQRICVEAIPDADSRVFFDLGSHRQDKSDAKRCYLLTPYTPKAYEEEFDEDPTTWEKEIDQSEFDWCTPDRVWVCELYRVEEKSEMAYWYQSLAGVERKVTESELKEDETLLEMLAASGFEMVRQKRVKRRAIKKYTLSGSRVLREDDIPGVCIPVVMSFGQRMVIDGVERAIGITQLAMDAQRIMNMLMSWLAEIAARFDVEKPILTPEQVGKHAWMWANDAVQRHPYLLLNPLLDASGSPVPAAPMAYTKAPNVPPAMAALLQIASEALNDLLGAQQAGEQLQPNQSGKAVELIQQRLDMQTFIYVDNFRQAVQRGGEIWLSMKSAVTLERERRMKTIEADGKAGSVVVNEPKVNEAGEEYLENDLSKATFDVVASVGPSSSSKRSATVRALTSLAAIAGNDPEISQALIFATLANLEGEGLDGLKEWGRKRSIRLGTVKPNEEEEKQLAQEQQNQQPDAQTQYLQASAREADARAIKATADAEKAQAQTMETLAGIDRDDRQQVVDTVEKLTAAPAAPPSAMQQTQPV